MRFWCLDNVPGRQDSGVVPAETCSASGRKRPVIPFFHYSIEGYYSDSWEREEKDAFAKALEGTTLAIFHGHEHQMGHYKGAGNPVSAPAPRTLVP